MCKKIWLEVNFNLRCLVSRILKHLIINISNFVGFFSERFSLTAVVLPYVWAKEDIPGYNVI